MGTGRVVVIAGVIGLGVFFPLVMVSLTGADLESTGAEAVFSRSS